MGIEQHPSHEDDAEIVPSVARDPLRSLAWAAWLLVAMGMIALLHAAADFFIPLLVGITLAYMLRPGVELLVGIRVPRVLAAFFVVIAALATAGFGIYSLADDATRLVETLPQAVRTVRLAMQDSPRDKPKAMSKMREAARELDRAAAEASGQPLSAPAPTPSLGSRVQDYMLAKGVTMMAVLGQVFFAALLAWYLLSEGDNFKRKMLRMVGTSLSRKKITVRILDDIDRQVQRQMATMFVVNGLIGVATAVSFWLLGVEQALLWGVVAGLLHFVPYIGQGIVTVASAAAAYLQFGSLGYAFVVALVTLSLSIVVGTVLYTWLQSRASRVNATVLFVAMLFFAWLWGPWGLVLAAPLVVMVKSVCDHVEAFRPAAELLAGRAPKVRVEPVAHESPVP